MKSTRIPTSYALTIPGAFYVLQSQIGAECPMDWMPAIGTPSSEPWRLVDVKVDGDRTTLTFEEVV